MRQRKTRPIDLIDAIDISINIKGFQRGFNDSVTNSGPRSAAKSACGLFFMRRSSKAMKSELSIMERMTPIK